MLPITYGNILAVFFNATDLETINGPLNGIQPPIKQRNHGAALQRNT
jgi:hypothetical protein